MGLQSEKADGQDKSEDLIHFQAALQIEGLEKEIASLIDEGDYL